MCLISPCLLSLDVGAAVGQGHRPEHFRVRSFPVRHACCSSLHCSTNTHTHTHTHTHTVINAHTPATSTRGHKGEVKWVIAATQIKYSWGWRTVCLNSNLRFSPECAFQPHTRSGIVIQKTKHKSINTRDSVTANPQLVLLRPYIRALCLGFFPPWEALHTAQLWMRKVYVTIYATMCGALRKHVFNIKSKLWINVSPSHWCTCRCTKVLHRISVQTF